MGRGLARVDAPDLEARQLLALAVSAYVALLGFLGLQKARAAFGFLGFLALLGLGPAFYRKRGKKGVVLDERER